MEEDCVTQMESCVQGTSAGPVDTGQRAQLRPQEPTSRPSLNARAQSQTGDCVKSPKQLSGTYTVQRFVIGLE